MPGIKDEREILSQVGSPGIFLVSSEKLRGGGVHWDSDPWMEFHIPPNEPRVAKLLQEAAGFKQAYAGLPLQQREIETINAVTVAINRQFGPYDPHYFTGKTYHEDVGRQNTNYPASIAEFGREELICRHRAGQGRFSNQVP